MLFTLYIAALAAMLWTLRWFYLNAEVPHDPTTLELAVMAAITMATYVWMQRLRAIRQRTAAVLTEIAPPPPIPLRYAEAVADATAEAALENAEHVA
jgi:hypothetical protein